MLHGTLCIQKHFRGLHFRQGYQGLKKGAMTLQSCNTLYCAFFLFKTFLNSDISTIMWRFVNLNYSSCLNYQLTNAGCFVQLSWIAKMQLYAVKEQEYTLIMSSRDGGQLFSYRSTLGVELQLPSLMINWNISFFFSQVIHALKEGLLSLYCPKVVHLSNHVFLYVSAVMRGCLARTKYKCLQNEMESKVSHNKVQGDMRKNISESRVCHVSSMSKDIILLSLPIS